MKLGGSQPAAAQPETPTPPAAPVDPNGLDLGVEQPAAPQGGDDKPFDDKPFEAGVEADEQSDPKKFIEQLTGKLGQSLRNYSQQQGQPDFALEKFAINSLLSATHTSEMPPEDQSDIIKKVETAGGDDSDAPNEEPTDNPEAPAEVPDEENTFDDSSEEGLNEMGLGDYRVKQLLDIYDKGSENIKLILTRLVSFNSNIDKNTFIKDVQEDVDPEDMDFIFNKMKEIGIAIPEPIQEKEDSIFLDEPKKNNMFQQGSNDILKQAAEALGGELIDENLQNGQKKSTFVVENTDMTAPITKPKVKPKTEPTLPSRRNRPFLPNVTPQVRPDPKAMKEETPEVKPVVKKKAQIDYEVYHKTFSSAVQAARDFALNKGYLVDDDEWYFRISSGPRKPDNGKTNRYTLELMKGGKLQKKHLHIQVYGMDNQYELNAYIN